MLVVFNFAVSQHRRFAAKMCAESWNNRNMDGNETERETATQQPMTSQLHRRFRQCRYQTHVYYVLPYCILHMFALCSVELFFLSPHSMNQTTSSENNNKIHIIPTGVLQCDHGASCKYAGYEFFFSEYLDVFTVHGVYQQRMTR